MSEIRVNTIVAAEGTSAPNLPYGVQVPTGMGVTGAGGLNITGIITAAGFFDTNGNDIVGTAATLNVRTQSVTVSGVSTFTGAANFSGAVNADATTESTSITSGALIVDGGAGVAKNLFVGDAVDVAKDINVGAAATIAGITKITNNTSSTSSSTGALVVTGGLGIGGDVFVGSGMSIAGTLTYEDATNIDSVGLVTAQSGVNIPGGQLVVGVAFSVGNSGVGTFAGNLVVNGDIDLAGSIDVDGTMEADAITVNGTALNTVIAGVTVTNATTAANVTVADESSDTTCFPLFADSATGNLSVKSGTNLTFNSSSGLLSATLLGGTINDAAQTNVTSLGTLTGLTVSGDVLFDNGEDAGKDLLWDVSQDALIHKDSVYASWGTDQDMSIWFDGSNSYIQNTTGTLNIRPKSGENGIVLTADADVKIYYDNSQKLITTNDGVSITGMSTVTTGAHFQGMLREDVNIVANKLSAATNINLEDGMIHYFSTNETTTATPNIRWSSTYTLNNKMSTGQAVTVTIISKPNGAGYYASATVDGNGVTEEWNGGSAPSSAESGGYDVLTHTLIKTADASFLCFSNTSNFA